MGYNTARCSLCPHGSTMHEASGHCLAPDCECPGYEPDPVPAFETGEEKIAWEKPAPTAPRPTPASLAEHRYQQVTPAEMGGVAESDAGDRGTTSAVAGSNPASSLQKSEVLKTSHQGEHYHGFAIEPIQYIEANALGFHEGNIIKYVSRWQMKNGVDDLKKALFYLRRLIEVTEAAERGD